MSFSYETKLELCRLDIQKQDAARAEACGVLLYCNTFQPGEIRIVTENPAFAARLPKLFRRAFRTAFDSLPEAPETPSAREAPEAAETAPSDADTRTTGVKRVFRIFRREKLDQIVSALGYDPRMTAVLHVNFALLEEDACRAAFLRGAFFAGGSVTDPGKRYHLELSTSHAQASREVEVLLRESHLPCKSLSRNGSSIVYFKQSEQIEDFLTFIGAPSAAMKVMDTVALKGVRNSANRRANCDTANVDKAVEAAQEQLEAIRRLRAAGVLEGLSDKLQLTAALRLEYPELSLSELAEEFDPPLTKSCLNHRLRKLTDLARGL
ncbi:MAG: DNA-binding protein WhiA [Oscillibacter sp.]|nr:DNA-binding protein WhiA [Oscillibacter sp.]